MIILLLFFLLFQPAQAAWYDSTWGYREKITIDHTKVSADLTDFPVYINTDNLGSNFYSHALSTCADVRITKSDGTTEVPREVVYCDGTNGELHFKASGTLSSSTDTDFYVYYGKSGASDYSTSATYGRNNVWTGFVRVAHAQTGTSTTDSTGNSSLTHTGTTGSINAVLGKGWDLAGSPNSITTNYAPSALTAITISCWVNMTGVTTSSVIFGTGGSPTNLENIIWQTAGGASSQIAYVKTTGTGSWDTGMPVSWTISGTTSWYKYDYVFTGSQLTIYENGVLKGSPVSTVSGTTNTTSNKLVFGMWKGGSYYPGYLDEIRVATNAKSSNWLVTEYNNQSSPGTFYSIGSEESAPITPSNYILDFGTVF